MSMKISFVFSFRNEEENIKELVKRVKKQVLNIKGLEYELIFVNDASTDKSEELLLTLQKTHPIILINMSRVFGTAPCVLAGFKEAQGDIIVYMDSDLQDPPELISEMYDKLIKGSDVVHAKRLKRGGESPFKIWLTKIAYKIINFFSDIDIPENTGDFKMLSRRVVDNILKLEEYDPFMRGLSIWVGFKQEFVYYNRDKRFAGKSQFPLFSKNPTREFIRGLTSFSAGPLFISFMFGLIVCIISILLIIYALITKLFGIAVPGVSGLLIAISFFSGSILISNGVLGIYISKIFFQVKGRPKYIIKDIFR